MLSTKKMLISTAITLALGLPYGLANSQSIQGPTNEAGGALLREGTELPLTFAQDLSSKTAAEGDPVMLTLAQDLAINGVVIARAGAKATGEVTNARKAGMMGKGGELNVRLDKLSVGDVKVRVRGTKGREGDSKVGAAVALTVLFGPVGLLKHGRDIEIRAGSKLTAYVADDIALPAANK
jgi:hypothetical protein